MGISPWLLFKWQVAHEDDVVVRVGFAGLCGTDLHIMSVSFIATINSISIYTIM